ncbi:transcriptional activator of glycolytic enzymes-domain-containing protein [Lipomyces kononenkoae]|uniref:Transcriptional activator of glycolytic enzymes-domain-containing protein n=1 Tax=Lipomyces kononenkoae TaxID=34357 RepID=A0ACC3SPZ6_LIPKO
MDEVLGSVTEGVSQLQGAIVRGQQETRELASRLSVMEAGFSYIFQGGSLVRSAAANLSCQQPLPRCVVTVAELYRIWYTGSLSFPSVVSLDERYGASWRSSDRQYYNVRLQIINEIDRLSCVQNISKADAVASLDSRRRINNWTLNKLSEEIRKQRRLY